MNKYLKYAASGVISAAMITSLSAPLAFGADNSQNNKSVGLINAIVQKFNLNYNDVKKVFDDWRASRQVQMDQRFEAKLDRGVAQGKITANQKAQILAKKAELEAFKLSLQGKSKEEIRVAVKVKMDELKQWADDNDIPVQYLMKIGLKGYAFGHFKIK